MELLGAGTLGVGTGLVLNGGNFVIGVDSGTKMIGTLNGDGIGIHLNNNTLNIDSGSFRGVITGIGGALTKTGSKNLSLYGLNTYSGGTTLAAGEVFVGSSAELGTGKIAMGDGTTLSLGSNITASNAIVLADSAIGSVNVSEGTGTLSGVIAGGALIKTGAGTLTLSGNNAHVGGTTIRGGKLYIYNASNLGSGDVLLEGGVLESLEDLTLSITINLLTRGELEVPTGTLTLSGQVMGNELVKTGIGTLVLTGDATYTGSSTIDAGTLELFGATTLGSGKGLIINGGSLAISMDAGTKTIATLDGGGDGINLNKNILEINSGSFAGVISGVGGALTKTGAGSLTLSGNNTFTGDLSINQGLLQIATEDALGKGSVALLEEYYLLVCR